MTTVEPIPAEAHTDRPRRSRPFSSWMKKLTNFKSSSSTDSSQNPKRNAHQTKSNSKKGEPKNNNPYLSAVRNHASSTAPVNGQSSMSTVPTGRTASTTSLERGRNSYGSSEEGVRAMNGGSRSVAPTISTGDHELAHSDIAQSHAASSGAGTTATIGPTSGRGADSTFSSPAPSVRSLTTTLTTIHSANAPVSNVGSQEIQGQNATQFTHQFPTSPPATALPAHLMPQTSGGHPSTYNTATANNLLTDNASILTLASSSKRRRRRSMDTDASVRALAPSSLFGGSRESLPLSVLSSNVEHGGLPTPGLHQTRQSVGGPAERASIYSSTGAAPALPSDRNSYYAGKQGILGDGVSVKSGKSGLFAHGRTDSVSGSIGGLASAAPTSPLASPNVASQRDVSAATIDKISRANSVWSETAEETETENEQPKRV